MSWFSRIDTTFNDCHSQSKLDSLKSTLSQKCCIPYSKEKYHSVQPSTSRNLQETHEKKTKKESPIGVVLFSKQLIQSSVSIFFSKKTFLGAWPKRAGKGGGEIKFSLFFLSSWQEEEKRKKTLTSSSSFIFV